MRSRLNFTSKSESSKKEKKKKKTNAADSIQQPLVTQANILECAEMSEGCCKVGGGSGWVTSGVLWKQVVLLGQRHLSSAALLLPMLLIPRILVDIHSRKLCCLSCLSFSLVFVTLFVSFFFFK